MHPKWRGNIEGTEPIGQLERREFRNDGDARIAFRIRYLRFSIRNFVALYMLSGMLFAPS
jgi:hypothetical protein